MDLCITSDLHLGSPHCPLSLLEAFLDRLPASATLVLNGDTLDHSRRKLPPDHQMALERLLRESKRRRVVWVDGNHDENVRPGGDHEVEFTTQFTVPARLCALHGFYLHRYIPGYQPLVYLIKALHRLRVMMGAEPIHIAQYIKSWAWLHGVLSRYVRNHAVRHARQLGYPVVVCGHVHQAEDTQVDGVRYVNTGTWTESPPWCFRVTDSTAALCRVTPHGELEM
jgi:UDP-2,3-diacylglucosamine pyrophosphatase LpxH